MVLFIISGLLLLLYAWLMFYYSNAWNELPSFSKNAVTPSVRFSVIIPARNEEKNIAALLSTLQKQDYPQNLFEVIVVDDHSTDGTAGTVSQFPGVRLISLTDDGINSYKKKAVETGIAAASYEWIVCTDADCLALPTWLSTIAAFIEKENPAFIAAPVLMQNNQSLLQTFQSMDFRVLQGITGASVHRNIYAMCNGANLAYPKNIFTEVGGFSGVDHLASGDDMLLMEKIRKKYPDRIRFLKSADAIVTTTPMESWPAFFQQRIRWASKTFYYKNAKIIAVLSGVYLFNLAFPVLLIAGYWCWYYWAAAAGLLVMKTLVELPFYSAVSKFFGLKTNVIEFFVMQPVHIVYTIISGLFSQFGTYKWKGRNVK